jgi:hypothetical protein
MKETKFTFLRKITIRFMVMSAILLSAMSADAQTGCSLGCNTRIQVSLDSSNCSALITPAMMVGSDAPASCPGAVLSVELRDRGVLLPSDTLNTSHIGRDIEVKIIDATSGNSCWGFVTVEYKYPPKLICPKDTISTTCDKVLDFNPILQVKCITATIQVTDIEVKNNDCASGLASNILKTVKRSFVAVDASGKRSEPCVINFTLKTLDSLGQITMPANLLAPSNNLQCDVNFAKDPQGNPHPSVTGVPKLGTVALWPTQNIACNIIASYSDVTLPSIGCVTKIMRTWSIIEWSCSNPQRTRTQLQMIEITDSKAPVISGLNKNITVSTNADRCEATFAVPAAVVTDNCSPARDVSVQIVGGSSLINTNGGTTTLPVGVHKLYYRATDGCGNSKTDSITVTVEDKTPPVAICNTNVVIGLSSEKTTFVNAASFNSGSYDECGPVTIRIRRMETKCTGGTTTFGDRVGFCCEDIANGAMVALEVSDKSNNVNLCMVNVQVQDKVNPKITCPASVEVSCSTPFNPANLGSSFGVATATDNCSVTVTERTISNNITQCGTGRIVRGFTAKDDGGRLDSCRQTITFILNDTFYVNRNNPADLNDDVEWPRNFEADGCGDPESGSYNPTITGSPKITSGFCQLVGVDYTDQIFTFNNTTGNSCFKIVRTWTIIDWCNQRNGTYYTASYQQTIIVTNKVKPVIESSCAAKETCTFDATCSNGFIELTASASDDCTKGLKWFARIDANNDGTFEPTLGKNGEGATATKTNPTVATASGTYPIGTHRVQWSFEDKCGNVTVCDQLFTIVNCKAPTPYLINGLAVSLMPIDTTRDGKPDAGMIELWASDFDNGSSHPCAGNKVLLSFSPNVNDRNKTFTCANIGRNNVTLYASIITPKGDTIRSFANTFVDIQDNNKACRPTNNNEKAVISGSISTQSKNGLSNASVKLESTESVIVKSDNSGKFVFDAMNQGGNYTLSASKNDDYSNGINTLDLVLMQRHILGLQKLNSPYLQIAGDVNNDKKITAADLVELRKLILGVNNTFTNNSWRFVDKSYTFSNPANVLTENIAENYNINNLNSNMSIDFVAVKIGDVSESALVNATSVVAENRSAKKLQLFTTSNDFAAGDDVQVSLSSDKVVSTTGVQFTLNFDPSKVEFKSITSADLNITENNIGLSRVAEGIVTLSWNNAEAINVVDLIDVNFVAKKGGNTASVLNITSDVTKAEAYSSSNEIMNVTLESRSNTAGFELFQNSPNPFTGNTNISFVLPADSQVDFKVVDLTGKVLKQISKEYTAGKHTITLEKSQLGQSGVLYYQLEAGAYIATKKMVVIE